MEEEGEGGGRGKGAGGRRVGEELQVRRSGGRGGGLTLMREIPMAPSVTWDLICSQTPVMNWCGMTNTRILAPRTASVMSGIATWWTTRCTATFF